MKRRLSTVYLVLLLSLIFPGCSEQEIVNDSSACAALPSFSSESELAEFLNEQNVYSESNPDMFAKPGYIPDGYILDEIILAPSSEGSDGSVPNFV